MFLVQTINTTLSQHGDDGNVLGKQKDFLQINPCSLQLNGGKAALAKGYQDIVTQRTEVEQTLDKLNALMSLHDLKSLKKDLETKVAEAEAASNKIFEDYLNGLQEDSYGAEPGSGNFGLGGDPQSADGSDTPMSSPGSATTAGAPSKKALYDRAKKQYFEARKKYHRMNAKLEKLKMLREN